MAADITYSVEVQYFSSGRIDAGLDNARRSVSSWSRDLDAVVRRERQLHRERRDAARDAERRQREYRREQERARREQERARRELERLHDRASRAASNFGASFGHGARSITNAFNSVFDSIATSLISTLTAAAVTAGTAMATAIGMAIKSGIEFNHQIEQAQISLAASFNATGVASDMVGGLRLAAATIEQMRYDAKVLPGEFKDLVNIMSMVAPILGAHGMGAAKAEQFAARTMLTAAIEGTPQTVAAREMAAMLEGSARLSMPLFRKMMSLGLTRSTTEFNEMPFHKRFEAINKVFDKLAPAAEAQAKSWETVIATIKDTIRGGLGQITAPLMNRIKFRLMNTDQNLGPLGLLVDKDGRKANIWAGISERLADGLVKAFDRGEQAIHRWYPAVRDFSITLYNGIKHAFERVKPILDRALDSVHAFMRDPLALEKLVHVASTLAALRVGSGLVGKAAGAFGGIAEIGQSLSVLSTIGVGAAELGVILPAVAAVVAAYGVATEGAIHALTDSTSKYHDDAVYAFSTLKKSVASLVNTLTKFDNSTRNIRDFFGVGLIYIVSAVIFELDLFVRWIRFAVDNWKTVFRFVNDAINKFGESLIDLKYWIANNILHQNLMRPDKPDDSVSVQRLHDLGYTYKHLFRSDAPAEREKEIQPPQHTTHIHKVEIKVEGNEDPNRVADLTVERLIELSKNPIRSPHDRNSKFFQDMRSF